MSEPLDNRTLGVISEMIENRQTASVPVARKLWKDRALLLDAAIRIRDWDCTTRTRSSGSAEAVRRRSNPTGVVAVVTWFGN